MAILTESRIAELLAPYLRDPTVDLLLALSGYLELLVRWNARTNLTAIRSPEEMVRRHFGESLFAAQHLGTPTPETLLDLGSGAGFPGIPIALLCPEIAVTLAESQNKKVTFLREVIRTLELKNVEVWAGRAEAMPSDQVFHTVTLRAVDDMAIALAAAAPRAKGQIALLSTGTPELPEEFTVAEVLPLPESSTGVLVRAIKA